jgi:hypothetical protein
MVNLRAADEPKAQEPLSLLRRRARRLLSQVGLIQGE